MEISSALTLDGRTVLVIAANREEFDAIPKKGVVEHFYVDATVADKEINLLFVVAPESGTQEETKNVVENVIEEIKKRGIGKPDVVASPYEAVKPLGEEERISHISTRVGDYELFMIISENEEDTVDKLRKIGAIGEQTEVVDYSKRRKIPEPSLN